MGPLDQFRNKFIVFEGTDATGKTSVAKALVDRLNTASARYSIDFSARFTYQPGDAVWGPIAPLIRSLCKDKRWNLSSCGNLFAFLLDRAECIDKIVRPSLAQGQTVVLDRYTYSTIAYQLFGKQIYEDIEKSCGSQVARSLLTWFKNPYPDVTPDVVFYFSEKVGSRIDDDNDMFDKATAEFNARVNAAYEKMFRESSNWIKVSPGTTAEETLENILCANISWS
jgi:dTMP kinase